ncbi:unnamed protein product, partial [Prorocentrum cordatum]
APRSAAPTTPPRRGRPAAVAGSDGAPSPGVGAIPLTPDVPAHGVEEPEAQDRRRAFDIERQYEALQLSSAQQPCPRGPRADEDEARDYHRARREVFRRTGPRASSSWRRSRAPGAAATGRGPGRAAGGFGQRPSAACGVRSPPGSCWASARSRSGSRRCRRPATSIQHASGLPPARE